jgi:alpha-ketoglutarate-dependent taurine dioxygenase
MKMLEVRELNPRFGVEVSGIEPAVPLPDIVLAELRRLFDEKGLIVIRDIDADLRFQTYLSHALIGEDPLANNAEILENPMAKRTRVVSNREPDGGAPFGRLLFHSDLMWSEDIYRLLSLYGVEVEEPTSPTLFASAVAGWETLPEDLRKRVEGLTATTKQDATYQKRADDEGDVLTSTFAIEESISLPIGHRHPRHGKTLLYVAQQMTHGIDGLDHDESEALLEELFQHLYRAENVVEHHWRERDLVLWDNIALQHARPNIRIEGPARTLRKILAPTPKPNWNNLPQFSTANA